MGTLTGKYAFVTGGNKGIGKAIIKRFLEDDIAGVALLGTNEERCISAARELDPSGEKVLPIKCDVSNQDEVKAAVDKAVEVFGTLDIIVNNAGITKDKIFHKMTDEMWDAVINVNLNGVYYVCKHTVPILRNKGYGRIVNISSTSALGNVGQANYAATKAAIQGFTKTLAKELAPKGVLVNAVAPGYIDTDMFAAIPEDKKAEMIKNVPMGRLADPSEIASVVSFLSGPDCSWITSQCIYVTGGVTTG